MPFIPAIIINSYPHIQNYFFAKQKNR